jgi:hypothetical protein
MIFPARPGNVGLAAPFSIAVSTTALTGRLGKHRSVKRIRQTKGLTQEQLAE